MVMCRLLTVSASGYYNWLNRAPSLREQEKIKLTCKIKAIFDDEKSRAGSPRITKRLNAEGDLLEEFSPEWRGFLFIDLFMPALNGIDVMKELLNRHCKMNIIVISGHGAAEVSKQAMNAGAHAFISKPLDVEKSLKHVSEILQMSP